MMRQTARTRRALGAAVLGGVIVAASACSDTTNEASFDSAGAQGSEGSVSGGTVDPESDDRDTEGGSTGGYDDDADETSAAGGSSGGDGTGSEPTPPSGRFASCPEELPEAWIFCEDFEALLDPGSVFFDYVDGEGNFTRSSDGGASGIGAMKAHYREGVEAAGFLSISFGQNPINSAGRPGYADADTFDEVYWRFRVKMQPGWPDAGPHSLTRISAFAQSDWGQAVVASIASADDGVVLRASGSTCVEAGEVPCTGIDADLLEPLDTLQGQTPVFSSDRAGAWQCIEAHVKLNAPGTADGVFEFWVDGNLEDTRDEIDWRGNWADFGLNLLTIENFWVGGAPADLDRWFDDLVISTQPIGCD